MSRRVSGSDQPGRHRHVVVKDMALLRHTREVGLFATFKQLTIPCEDRAKADALCIVATRRAIAFRAPNGPAPPREPA